MLQTEHKDVFLGYFKSTRWAVEQLRSGDALFMDGEYVQAKLGGRAVRVAKFSRTFAEKPAALQAKGYMAASAAVTFVVKWKGENETEETPIVLMSITLRKR